MDELELPTVKIYPPPPEYWALKAREIVYSQVMDYPNLVKYLAHIRRDMLRRGLAV
jgi:hypothetical protein